MTTETRFKVEGMGCGSCVKHVGDALRGQAGVEHVDVQLAEGRAIVQHTGADLRALTAALEKAGYPASVEG